MTIKNFKDLDIWKKGMEIAGKIYLATEGFPEVEKYGIVSQLRRSAVSVPSNISEGFNRIHNKEYKQFLYVALGSCAEIETQILLSFQLQYLSNDMSQNILEMLDHETRMIRNLIKKL